MIVDSDLLVVIPLEDEDTSEQEDTHIEANITLDRNKQESVFRVLKSLFFDMADRCMHYQYGVNTQLTESGYHSFTLTKQSRGANKLYLHWYINLATYLPGLLPYVVVLVTFSNVLAWCLISLLSMTLHD